MTKFPVVRDLMVDRSRIFEILEKVRAWLPVDSYLDMGPGLRQSQEQQQMAYLYSKCMSCGCCLEACPQFLKIELVRRPGETDAALAARLREANMRAFMGARAIAQVELFNSNPNRRDERHGAAQRAGGRGRDSSLWQRELREGLPQRNPPHHRHCPRRPGRHVAHVAEMVRSVGGENGQSRSISISFRQSAPGPLSLSSFALRSLDLRRRLPCDLLPIRCTLPSST